MIAKIDNRRRAACDRDCLHTLGNFPRRRVGVRGTAGDRQNSKSFDSKVICQLLNDLRPIDQFAIRLKTGIANAGAIRRNDFHAQLPRSRLGQLRHCARARPTVKKENGHARSAAVLGVSEFAAIFQPKHFALVHQAPIIPDTRLEQNPLSCRSLRL